MRVLKKQAFQMSYTKPVYIVQHDMDILGHKLDNVRQVLSNVYPNTWAYNFWRQVEKQLERKFYLATECRTRV